MHSWCAEGSASCDAAEREQPSLLEVGSIRDWLSGEALEASKDATTRSVRQSAETGSNAKGGRTNVDEDEN